MASISMFDQIKTEPLQFYPSQTFTNPQQPGTVILQSSSGTIIGKPNESTENILLEHIKPEIISTPQLYPSAQSTTSSSSRSSKPQTCKICNKVLSSASSYYVHMKLHSGSKPFQCKFTK